MSVLGGNQNFCQSRTRAEKMAPAKCSGEHNAQLRHTQQTPAMVQALSQASIGKNMWNINNFIEITIV